MNRYPAPRSAHGPLSGPPDPPPGPVRYVLARLAWLFLVPIRALRNRWLLSRGVSRAAHWWRPRAWPQVGLRVLGGILFLGWLTLAVLVTANVQPSMWNWVPLADPLGLDVLAGTIVPLLALAWGAVVFLANRLNRVRRHYLCKATRETKKLVQTAGSILGDVVGRDPLCRALMENLRDPHERRVHIVVGGIGAGKTALLVRLTQLLAGKGAVPVPVRMRDAVDTLDFTDMAKDRFLDEVSPKLSAPSEGERIWQWLRHTDDRIVVLADGLEEALLGKPDRDNLIRTAVRKAQEHGLPLVVTSRPHAPVRALEAAVTDLEPLNEEAALRYVARGSGSSQSKHRLDWVVEAANVAEAPLFLEIAKQLGEQRLLEQVLLGDDKVADPRDKDQWQLRYDLLDTWLRALLAGDIHPELPLGYEERLATVEILSALACIGLREDTAEIQFKKLAVPEPESARSGADASGDDHRGDTDPYQKIRTAVEERLKKVRSPRTAKIDVRMATAWGTRMGLVDEEGGDRVQFRHRTMQAFFGSRFLGVVINDRVPLSGATGGGAGTGRTAHVAVVGASPGVEAVVLGDETGTGGLAADGPERKHPAGHEPGTNYFPGALENPGREITLAMIFHSRSKEGECTCVGRSGEEWCPAKHARDLLWNAAGVVLDRAREAEQATDGRAPADANPCDDQSPHQKALTMYAAALDIDSFEQRPRHKEIARQIADQWSGLRDQDPQKLDIAKQNLVRRMGATARLVEKRKAEPCYDELFKIGCRTRSYSVRFAVGEELGRGGDKAYEAMYRRPATITDYEYLGSVEYSTPTPPGGPRPERDGDRPELRTEHRRRRDERDSGDEQERKEERREQEEFDRRWDEWHKTELLARSAPVLVARSGRGRRPDSPYAEVETQVRKARDGELRFDEQACLAQGFRLAANLRPEPRHRPEAREFLMEQAREMLRNSQYWYVRLTLLQALTLWALPADPGTAQWFHGRGAAPAAKVRRWLEVPGRHGLRRWLDLPGRHGGYGRHREHPYVRAAAKLCRRALQTRRPDRFLWIDDAGAVARSGSETDTPEEPRCHNLWISPSAGWSTLDPAAQQLLSDVLLLLNLTERADRPDDRKRRFERTAEESPYLPYCLHKDRTPLDPMRTVVVAARSWPGSNCSDRCAFDLCPYPPKAMDCRVEFSEIYCMRQRELLKAWRPWDWLHLRFRRRGPWQWRTPGIRTAPVLARGGGPGLGQARVRGARPGPVAETVPPDGRGHQTPARASAVRAPTAGCGRRATSQVRAGPPVQRCHQWCRRGCTARPRRRPRRR